MQVEAFFFTVFTIFMQRSKRISNEPQAVVASYYDDWQIIAVFAAILNFRRIKKSFAEKTLA
jgi:hypothetical protein